MDKKDLQNQVFGDYTVLYRDNEFSKKPKWICRCSCGKVSSVFETNLLSGLSERCNDWKRHPRKTRPCTSICTILDDVAVVECANGENFIIDVQDVRLVANKSWYRKANGYFQTNIAREKCYLHRLIMGARENEEVDHISGDKKDNRRVNLRFCTRSENQMNMKIRSINKTGFKGVFRAKGRKKYRASITANGKVISLLSYDTPLEAAQAYNVAAEILHKEFAVINDVPPPTEEFEAKIRGILNRLFSAGGFVLPSESEVTV